MPDNVPISPGQGATIATDQDPVTGAHYQRVKLTDGTEGSSDKIQSDGQGSLQVYVTEADIEDLKTGNANVKVVNGPDEVLHVRIVHQGRSQSGSCVPVVLASDHDPVPVASANLPLVGGALGANGAIWGPIPLAGCNGLTLQISVAPMSIPAAFGRITGRAALLALFSYDGLSTPKLVVQLVADQREAARSR